MTTILTIPTISLQAFVDGDAQTRAELAAEVDDICRTIGFLVVRDHGLADETLAAAWRTAREFFDLPLKEKVRSCAPTPGSPRGYFPLESETLAKSMDNDTPPDIKESFSCCPLRSPTQVDAPADELDFFYGENIWPAEPREFRAAWEDYYRGMEVLGRQVMQLFARALDLDEDYFETAHTHHLGAMRALNYPATDRPPLPGQCAAGEHADYGSVTILRPDPEVAGLEIRMPDDSWLAAPQVADAFIVNIGDMLACWTNDRWVSTRHRVTPLPQGARRQSIAYFMNPNYDAEIRCIPTCLARGEQPAYAPVMAGRYLMNKFLATQ